MKEIDELEFPENLRYAEDHEWTQKQGDHVRIGISDYAQDQLGDVVYVELPQKGEVLARGDAFGSVESVKAVSELYMPIGGEILSVNTQLEDAPEHVNQSPYHDGWMIEVKPDDPGQMDSLMDRDAYIGMLKG